jgi:hypothetical protein
VPRTTPHSQPPPTPIQVRHRTTATEKAHFRGYPNDLFFYPLNARPSFRRQFHPLETISLPSQSE